MKKYIEIVTQKQNLTISEAQEVIFGISEGKFNANEISCFISLFMMRPITIDELLGFRLAFLSLCKSINFNQYNTLDMCGTGGDGKNTFNISTLASFVVSSCDIPVVKHGNYGLSSVSGSSNVLENLGITLSNNEDLLKKSLDQAGISILHAPLFHPAMKSVSEIRKNLNVKTFFNIIGPLINPSNPKFQVIGVYNLEIARLFTYMLQNTSTEFSIVNTLDGYDEISLTSNAKIINKNFEIIFNPDEFKGVKKISAIEIFGGKTKNEASAKFLNILNGKGTESENNVVAINAAVGINLVKKCSLNDAFEIAKEKLINLEALNRFNKLKKICQ